MLLPPPSGPLADARKGLHGIPVMGGPATHVFQEVLRMGEAVSMSLAVDFLLG
jgi:hypothetical protein